MTVYVPYDGIIRKLMYEVGAVATKGEPLVMVEVDGESAEGERYLEKIHLIIIGITFVQQIHRLLPLPKPRPPQMTVRC